MKKYIYIVIIVSIALPSNIGTGFIKNIIVPGWGFENKQQSKKYFFREVVIWGTIFSAKNSSDMLQGYYSSYGIDYANADIANNDLEYSMNVGNYNSMSLYNEAMLRKRQGDDVYPENEGYDWNWNSNDHRLKYRKIFEASSNLGKVADFAVAGLIINRMIAGISYLYYHRTGSESKISSDFSKSDKNTFLLKLKYNF
jgi:hypothetical protein